MNADRKARGHRGYIGSRTYAGQRPPQHVQNLVVRDYCERHGLRFLLSATEYAVPGSYLMLESVLESLEELDGIVLYSLFLLPEDAQARRDVYRRVLAAGADLHFAVEDLALRTEGDVPAIEDLLAIARIAPSAEPADDGVERIEIRELDFLGDLHGSTSRDYVQRVVEDDKAACATVAKRWGRDYWDGERRYGYGGYTYDGRWLPLAERIAAHYGLQPGQRVLDVGCGKAHLLFELTRAVPGLEVAGVDVSTYGIEHAKEEVRPLLQEADATELPFDDASFDLVFSINTLHNLKNFELDRAFRELQRVGQQKRYVCVESYRDERQKANLLYWQLTCESFYTPAEWRWFAARAGYRGDMGFITFS